MQEQKILLNIFLVKCVNGIFLFLNFGGNLDSKFLMAFTKFVLFRGNKILLIQILKYQQGGRHSYVILSAPTIMQLHV